MKLGLIASTAVLCAASVTASNLDEGTTQLRQPKADADSDQMNRKLDMDWWTEGEETCLTGIDQNGRETYGECDKSRFPKCGNKASICYNRTNRRDSFWPDGQAKFYINYNRVFCYPNSWEGYGGCSSCSPGRWCNKEKRCILLNKDYKCWN